MSYAVTSCYPEFQERVRRGYNLTGILEFFRSERTMSALCGYVHIDAAALIGTVTRC